MGRAYDAHSGDGRNRNVWWIAASTAWRRSAGIGRRVQGPSATMRRRRPRRPQEATDGWMAGWASLRNSGREPGISTVLLLLGVVLMFIGVCAGASAIGIRVSEDDNPNWRGARNMGVICLVLGLGLWVCAHRFFGGGWGLWILVGYSSALLSGLLLLVGGFLTLVSAGNIITGNATNEMAGDLGAGLAALGLSFVLKRLGAWSLERGLT